MDPLPPAADEAAFLARLANDERFYIECCLSVMSKSAGRVVPFKFNAVQEWYEGQRSKFDIILKARKQGFSTRIIAKAIHTCAFKPNQHGVLICQDKNETQKQLDLRFKPMVRSSLVPLKVEERKDYLIFPETQSRLYIGTAGTKKFGRGSDITFYHLSEVAHYEDPELITGIEEACLDGAWGVLETTANGENFFKQWWTKAVLGESRYKAIFSPWFADPTYCHEGKTISDPTEDEIKLVETFGLSQGQLAWRRWKLKDMSEPGLFAQEFPATSDEAFLAGGRMVFDWPAVAKHAERCADAPWRGFLREMGGVVRLDPQAKGAFHIWKNPEARHVYVVGADIAEGLKDGCYSAAFVLDAGTMEQVAEWHGHVPPDVFGPILIQIAQFYNGAILAPESWPGCGAITMQKIVDLGYTNFYRRQPRGTRTKPEELYGWETTHRTRPAMLLNFAGAVRDFDFVFHSKGLLEEMRSFIYDEAGEMRAQLGCYSDRIMAAAIAMAVCREVASGVRYDKPKLKDLERALGHGGSMNAPTWHGPRYGWRAT